MSDVCPSAGAGGRCWSSHRQRHGTALALAPSHVLLTAASPKGSYRGHTALSFHSPSIRGKHRSTSKRDPTLAVSCLFSSLLFANTLQFTQHSSSAPSIDPPRPAGTAYTLHRIPDPTIFTAPTAPPPRTDSATPGETRIGNCTRLGNLKRSSRSGVDHLSFVDYSIAPFCSDAARYVTLRFPQPCHPSSKAQQYSLKGVGAFLSSSHSTSPHTHARTTNPLIPSRF